MFSFIKTPLWKQAQKNRKIQGRFGWISAIFFAVALVGLIDGLQAQMRAGSNVLAILPGQTITISGPTASKNPLQSDIIAAFTPNNAPLRFEFDDFFSGYWFGSGMWRANIIASPDANDGQYGLRVAFRGAAAQNAQTYVFNVYASLDSLRAHSDSFLYRYLSIQPYLLASYAAAIGIILGIITYIYGRKYARTLARLSLAQVWTNSRNLITCLVPKKAAPPVGAICAILTDEGALVEKARCEQWRKGKLYLKPEAPLQLPPGALVYLDFATSEPVKPEPNK